MELKEYFRPDSLEEAKALAAKYRNLKLLAGGTDLVLELNRDKICPEYLLDLGKVEELKSITEDNDFIILGSMVTFTELKESKIVGKYFNSLIECSKNMGSPQIRNIATIGGNICNAGSAADIIPCLISLGGILIIESTELRRKISCESYFENYSKEKINEAEILTRIIIPKKQVRSGYYKLGKRNSLAIARVSAAVSLNLEEGKIVEVSVGLGAVGRYPFKVKDFDRSFIGQDAKSLMEEEALKLIENAVYESIKGRKTMPFKKEAVKGVYKEALRIALANE